MKNIIKSKIVKIEVHVLKPYYGQGGSVIIWAILENNGRIEIGCKRWWGGKVRPEKKMWEAHYKRFIGTDLKYRSYDDRNHEGPIHVTEVVSRIF